MQLEGTNLSLAAEGFPAMVSTENANIYDIPIALPALESVKAFHEEGSHHKNHQSHMQWFWDSRKSIFPSQATSIATLKKNVF